MSFSINANFHPNMDNNESFTFPLQGFTKKLYILSETVILSSVVNRIKYTFSTAACSLRYFGKLCTRSPSGRFGYDCGGKCLPECTDEYCDYVKGCLSNIHYSTITTLSGTILYTVYQNRFIFFL